MLKFGSPRKDEPPATAAKPLESPARPLEPPVARVPLPIPDAPRTEGPQMPTNSANHGESILAAGLTIEGKIEGSGNFRVVGRFKGTVKVNGELTIEPGAFIEGEITAESVLVAGDVRGQIAGGVQGLRDPDRRRQGQQRDRLRRIQDARQDGVRVEGG